MEQKLGKSHAPRKKIALALQGGGVHGAFCWGVLDKILEDGRLEVEGLSGTSAGGMNAVAFLHGMAQGSSNGARQKLQELWKTVSDCSVNSPYKPTPFDQMTNYFNLDRSPGTFMAHKIAASLSPYQWNPTNFNPLSLVMEKCFDFNELPFQKAPKVFLCATHVATGKLKIFSNKDLSRDVMLASACLPKLFQAVKVNEEYYWDGGYAGNPAIFPLIDGCETQDIVLIQLTSQNSAKLPMTVAAIEDRLMEINSNLSLLREMRAIYFVTKLIDQKIVAEGKLKRLNMHVIRNESVFEGLAQNSALNTNWKFIQYLFQWGRKTMEAWLNNHFSDVGVRSTFNIDAEFVT